MRVSIIDINGNIATVEMDDEGLIEDLKALVEVEVYFPLYSILTPKDEYSFCSTNSFIRQ